MLRLAFDIETNGLLKELDKIHCIVLEDIDTGRRLSAHTPEKIQKAIRLLAKADVLIGHNILSFDIPAIQKIHPDFSPKGQVMDTLLMSYVLYSNVFDLDARLVKADLMPKNVWGRHSLKAWGYRVNVLKGEFAEETDWAEWSPAMQAYCEQDVTVTKKVWDLFSPQISGEWYQIELELQKIINDQEERGFGFDELGAIQLAAELRVRKSEIERELHFLFPPRYLPGVLKTPSRTANYKDPTRPSVIKDCQWTSVIYEPFKASSRPQIISRLKEKYGWVPEEETENGNPKVDETVLERLEYPEAKLLQEYLMIDKRLGQIAAGKQAWLKAYDPETQAIHGRCIISKTATSRAAHVSPNLGQIVSVEKPYGKECRSLFRPPEGMKQVGIDVSGLELRVLAHFLAEWDGGMYVREVLEGDIHVVNQKAAGLPTRSLAKTFIYAFIYGSGATNLGALVGGGAKEGKAMIASFTKKIPALANLKKRIAHQFKSTGKIKLLDGRYLICRSEHSALNFLLQGTGSIICKKWINLFHEMMEEKGYVLGTDYYQMAWVHDEIQLAVRPEITEEVGELCIEAIKAAGEHFNLNIPLDGEYKIGNNWAECH